MNYLIPIIEAMLCSIIALFFMWAVKKLDDRRTAFNEDFEIVDNCNMAVALRKSGIYLGFAIGLYGVIHGPGQSFAQDIIKVVLESAVLLIALFIAYLVNDKLILAKVDNDSAVENNNKAVGFVEFGSYIATGLIINGSFYGEGGSFWSVVVFFLIGQATLIALFFLYDVFTACNLSEEIEEKGNVAAGISACGVLIAFAVILRASIAGPFNGWANDLKSFLFSLMLSLVLLGTCQIIINRLFLPSTTYKKEIVDSENAASALITSGVLISVALVIASAI
jgi:uncharacterized membrane protein YjfL (UPF0719 family)